MNVTTAITDLIRDKNGIIGAFQSRELTADELQRAVTVELLLTALAMQTDQFDDAMISAISLASVISKYVKKPIDVVARGTNVLAVPSITLGFRILIDEYIRRVEGQLTRANVSTKVINSLRSLADTIRKQADEMALNPHELS